MRILILLWLYQSVWLNGPSMPCPRLSNPLYDQPSVWFSFVLVLRLTKGAHDLLELYGGFCSVQSVSEWRNARSREFVKWNFFCKLYCNWNVCGHQIGGVVIPATAAITIAKQRNISHGLWLMFVWKLRFRDLCLASIQKKEPCNNLNTSTPSSVHGRLYTQHSTITTVGYVSGWIDGCME